MPNWVSNWGTITVSSTHADEVKAALNEGRFLSYIAKPPSPEGDMGWQEENWGTKWEVDDSRVSVETECDEEVKLRVDFATAWSPPDEAYKTLWEMEHILDIQMYAEEGGMGFCSYWKNGDTDQFDDYEPPEDEDEDEEPFDHWLKWVDEKLGTDLYTPDCSNNVITIAPRPEAVEAAVAAGNPFAAIMGLKAAMFG